MKLKDIGVVKIVNSILLLIVFILIVVGIYCAFIKKNTSNQYSLESSTINGSLSGIDSQNSQNNIYEEFQNKIVGTRKLDTMDINEFKEEFSHYNQVDNATYSVENISLKIKEGTLARTGVTLLIEDKNDIPYSYDEWYIIEKKINKNWQRIRADNMSFNEIAWMVGKSRRLEQVLDWEWFYGSLENGTYRIVKRVYEHDSKEYSYFYIEFDIQ